ncbi:MAG: hypothetical protein IJV16_04950 [Lachnospiraceae bacterium]|nr:hypothetical protein [Lachnospiraceae bacterium]
MDEIKIVQDKSNNGKKKIPGFGSIIKKELEIKNIVIYDVPGIISKDYGIVIDQYRLYRILRDETSPTLSEFYILLQVAQITPEECYKRLGAYTEMVIGLQSGKNPEENET